MYSFLEVITVTGVKCVNCVRNKMSGIGEQVPLHCIKENEELNLENKDGRKIDGRPKKNSSVRSGDAPVIPLIR